MRSSTKIALDSNHCFLDDGTLDEGEVRHLFDLALENGTVDDDEKRVLERIFGKVTRGEVSPKTWELMNELKKLHF